MMSHLCCGGNSCLCVRVCVRAQHLCGACVMVASRSPPSARPVNRSLMMSASMASTAPSVVRRCSVARVCETWASFFTWGGSRVGGRVRVKGSGRGCPPPPHTWADGGGGGEQGGQSMRWGRVYGGSKT